MQLPGHVSGVDGDYVWCAFSTDVRGRAFLGDATRSLEECEGAARVFRAGAPVTVSQLLPALLLTSWLLPRPSRRLRSQGVSVGGGLVDGHAPPLR
jgi:hypothetical protein